MSAGRAPGRLSAPGCRSVLWCLFGCGGAVASWRRPRVGGWATWGGCAPSCCAIGARWRAGPRWVLLAGACGRLAAGAQCGCPGDDQSAGCVCPSYVSQSGYLPYSVRHGPPRPPQPPPRGHDAPPRPIDGVHWAVALPIRATERKPPKPAPASRLEAVDSTASRCGTRTSACRRWRTTWMCPGTPRRGGSRRRDG